MVELPYGRVPYPIDLVGYDAIILRAPARPAPPALGAILDAALDAPVGRPRIERMVAAGTKVTVIVSDDTRVEPRAAFLDHLRARLPAVRWTVAVATGTHGPSSLDALALPAHIRRDAHIVNHDGHSDASLVTLGTTSRGTPVQVHRCLLDADLVIATGCIRPHYFAGFGAGVKAIFPGLGGAASIRRNHALKTHPSARAGIFVGNACRADLEEAAALLPTPTFLLNGVCAPASERAGISAAGAHAARDSVRDPLLRRDSVDNARSARPSLDDALAARAASVGARSARVSVDGARSARVSVDDPLAPPAARDAASDARVSVDDPLALPAAGDARGSVDDPLAPPAARDAASDARESVGDPLAARATRDALGSGDDPLTPPATRDAASSALDSVDDAGAPRARRAAHGSLDNASTTRAPSRAGHGPVDEGGTPRTTSDAAHVARGPVDDPHSTEAAVDDALAAAATRDGAYSTGAADAYSTGETSGAYSAGAAVDGVLAAPAVVAGTPSRTAGSGVPGSEENIHFAVAGDPISAFRVGADLARSWFTVRGPRASLVIASDALPVTASLYQAAKIAAAVAPLVDESGILLLVAECADGVGPLDVVNEAIFRIGVLPRLAPGVAIHLVSSLSRDEISRTLVNYAPSVETVLRRATGPVVVVPRASQLIIEPLS